MVCYHCETIFLSCFYFKIQRYWFSCTASTDTFGALDHDTNDSFGVMDAESLTEIVVTAVEEAKVAPTSYEYDEFGRVKEYAE